MGDTGLGVGDNLSTCITEIIHSDALQILRSKQKGEGSQCSYLENPQITTVPENPRGRGSTAAAALAPSPDEDIADFSMRLGMCHWISALGSLNSEMATEIVLK